jgi:hypothetical protein
MSSRCVIFGRTKSFSGKNFFKPVQDLHCFFLWDMKSYLAVATRIMPCHGGHSKNVSVLFRETRLVFRIFLTIKSIKIAQIFIGI